MATNESKKREMLKQMIQQLHAGAPPEAVKERFKQVLEGVSSIDIAKIEDDLIREGMPREEIQRLCEVHLAVFKEQMEKEKTEVATENPIFILEEEHKILLQLSEKLISLMNAVKRTEDKKRLVEMMPQLESVIEALLDAEKHYLREENVLFPLLEKHGVKEPPAIMWMEHNQLREGKKKLQNLVKSYDGMTLGEFKKQFSETAMSLTNTISSHIFKENNILFPTALKIFTNEDWKEIRKGFTEVGYSSLTPEHLRPKVGAKAEEHKAEAVTSPEGLIQLETGTLSKEELEALLNTLPVEITFVDKNDTVRYYSHPKEMLFVRTKAVLGRKVQQCHPQKSIHIVNQVLDSFKSGRKDVAEFWITFKDRFVHIRYFPLRDKNGNYLGCVEITQDITDIKKLEGTKRLLDWKD